MSDLVKHEAMANMRVYQFSTRLFKLFLLVWHRVRICGAENIPERGGVLLASNHASFLDPSVIGVGYRVRPVHFMARNTLWNSKFGTWWMTKVGCIPVSRGTGDIRALKAEKKHAAEQAAAGAQAIVPVSALVNLVEGTEDTQIRVMIGDYDEAIDKRIAEIQTTCNIE